jgi:hypothetical protein
VRLVGEAVLRAPQLSAHIVSLEMAPELVERLAMQAAPVVYFGNQRREGPLNEWVMLASLEAGRLGS